MTEKMLLTTDEAAAALGIGRTKMQELIYSANFPKVRIGRCIRVPVSGLQKWVDQQAAVNQSGPGAGVA